MNTREELDKEEEVFDTQSGDGSGDGKWRQRHHLTLPLQYFTNLGNTGNAQPWELLKTPESEIFEDTYIQLQEFENS